MSYAIDKILGKNEQDENVSAQDNMRGYPPVDGGAPSYSEFKATHNFNGNIDVAPRSFGMGEPYPIDDVRRDVRQPYGEQGYAYPRQDNGYMQQGIGQDMRQAMPQDMPRQNYARRDYYQPQNYANYQTQFYGFAAQDDLARRTEFENKLASVNNYSRQTEKEAEHADAQNKPKMRKKLNAKGAVILALYLVVVAVVITLIGVNAGKINSGKAVVPASEVTTMVEKY